MKLSIHQLPLVLGLCSCLVMGACKKTATDPQTGNPVDINEPDPSTQAEKAAAYKKLEDAKADNEKWRKYAEEHGNTALVASIDENLEMIADAKDELGYTPPKQEQALGHSMATGLSAI